MSVSKFPEFARMVAGSFQKRVKDENVLVGALDGDALYEKYLAAFPEGTNPIFKKRSEHDCSTCKHFVRRAGNVITIDGSLIRTVWDEAAKDAPYYYRDVAVSLRDAVRAAGISDLYRVGVSEAGFGAAQTRSMDAEAQRVVTHDHFYTGEIPRNLRVALPGKVCGDYRTTVQVFERGLVELTPYAVETVLELVAANSIYRGEEHKAALTAFQKMQREFLKGSARERNLFVWANARSPVARFRGTVIGTLVQALSEGQDIESAVLSFEAKVAPQNYRRTTALITPGMVREAMKTIEALGLEPALERRFAVIGDVSVRDVLWIDGAVKPLTKGGIGDVLMQHATSVNKNTAKDEERAEQISLDDFVAKILPESTSVEIMFKSEQVGNLMSLTAPTHSESKQLFQWSNDFAWSYSGGVADSIKERVKKAGGKVDGVLRVSLSWFNYDDLDLHVHEPPGRGAQAALSHIYYGNKLGWTGGKLDVDMNAGTGQTREAVENVVWAAKPMDGPYRIVVNNFNQRENSNPGFVVEVESGGRLSHYSYNKAVRMKQDVSVLTLHVKTGTVERVEIGDPGISSSNISQERWGLSTEKYIKVNAVMLSPNHWGTNAVGNRHTFFVLEGAKNDEPTRGFYNEFLNSRLTPHRKVFEIIAERTKCQPTDGQLSGLGFSSTKKDTFTVRVQQGKRRRIFNVTVGA